MSDLVITEIDAKPGRQAVVLAYAGAAADGAGDGLGAPPKDGPDKRADLHQRIAALEGVDPEKRMIYAHVDEQSVATIVSDWTGIPVGRMVKDEIENILKEAELKAKDELFRRREEVSDEAFDTLLAADETWRLLVPRVDDLRSRISLAQVAHWQSYMLYDPARLHYAIATVLAFSTVSLLFVFARFSFGYFIGFSLFTMVLGFIWLNTFSKFNYDHWLAGLSAAASAVLFLLPALLINAPIKRTFELSPHAVEHLLKFILVLALATIAAASFYNFRLVSIRHIYDFRNDLYFPAPIRYLTGIVSTVLLPFACACYLALNRRWWAAVPLILLLLFYPITLSKSALFSTAWVVSLLVLSRIFHARAATILSILLPMLLGVIVMAAFLTNHTLYYFGLVNIRMADATIQYLNLDVIRAWCTTVDLERSECCAR